MMDYQMLASLVELAKQGDYEAFAQVYEALSKPVYYASLRITKNEEDAHDVVQETMITLYKHLYTLEDSKAVVAYVNRVAYHHCMHILRKKKHIDDYVEPDMKNMVSEDEEFLPETYLETKEQRNYLVAYIDALSEPYRIVILMFYYSGFSISQIAKTLGVNEGTVKTRLSRARATLKKKLDADKKDLRCIVPIPVLTRVLQAHADEIFTTEVSIALWQSIATKLGLPADVIAKTTSTITPSQPETVTATTAVSTTSATIPALLATTCIIAAVGGGLLLLHQNAESSPMTTISSPIYESSITQPSRQVYEHYMIYEDIPLTSDSVTWDTARPEADHQYHTALPIVSENTSVEYVMEIAHPIIYDDEVFLHFDNTTVDLDVIIDGDEGMTFEQYYSQQVPDAGLEAYEPEVSHEYLYENLISDTLEAPEITQVPPLPPDMSEESENTYYPEISPPIRHAPPQVTTFEGVLQYPVGMVVTAQQILQDTGISLSHESGRVFDFNIAHLDLVDFNTPNRYVVHAQVLEDGAVVVQLVVIIEVI
ncbi:MAG: sigma-70 family RNA polymerase sigma factor [Defluviitaleaceae bacterium]|nr:sigma-70 family RNA polymerase sigma factor [Defluviitaleaceae bacterium]